MRSSFLRLRGGYVGSSSVLGGVGCGFRAIGDGGMMVVWVGAWVQGARSHARRSRCLIAPFVRSGHARQASLFFCLYLFGFGSFLSPFADGGGGGFFVVVCAHSACFTVVLFKEEERIESACARDAESH